jgi:hypothetical protein
MTIETLFAELETLSYDQRLLRMIALGKESRINPEAKALLAALEAEGTFYARLLRLQACIGSRDGATVLRGVRDESRILRGFAGKLVSQFCSDEEAVQALVAANKDLRRLLLCRLLRYRRRPVIDTFLETLAAQDGDSLSRWIAYGSDDFVRAHREQVLPRFDWNDWGRLTRQHPEIAFAEVRKQIQEQAEPDARLRTRVNAILPELSRRRPDFALVLAESVLKYEAPARIVLQEIAKRRPNEIAVQLLAQEDGAAANVDFSPVAHRLSEANLLRLLQERPGLLYRPGHGRGTAPQIWMRRLSPALRRTVFTVAGVGWRSSEGIIEPSIIATLPADLREAEAHRHLLLPTLTTRPAQRLPYATYLPWDEANEILLTFLQNPNPDLRMAGLSAQIGVARYHPERLPDALALIRSRANEQDPVRGAMLAALAALPPSRWNTTHLDDLSQIVQETLNAADLSYNTGSHLETLLLSLIGFHSEWAAPWLGVLARSRGTIAFSEIENRLTDTDVERIAPFLLPVFASWETREREMNLVVPARNFRRRLRAFDGLVEILQRVAQTTKTSYLASGIVSLFTRYLPERLEALVLTLLENDPSTITLAPVSAYLHRKRQDLLTPFLGQKAYSGRFSTGKTYFVLPLQSHFFRWTRAQQEQFAETLQQIVTDEPRDIPTRQNAAHRLATLPAIAPDRLIALAGIRSVPAALRDAAIRELARLDAGQGIPTLIEALNDSRARIAIYALRSAILEMPVDRALSLLQSVPTEKVTVAKEVVRLLGELKTPATYPVLLQMDTRPLHRDVRVALLRALWDHLEQDETWPVLTRAALDPDASVASGVVRIPTDRLSSGSQKRLIDLIALLLVHPEARVRLDTLERCQSLPLTDGERTLLPPLLTCLASPYPDETRAAAQAVFATYAGNTAQDAVAIGAGILQIKADRRVLQATLETLHGALAARRSRLRATVRAVLDALADDPATVRTRAVLAISGLPWDGVIAFLSRLVETNDLHAEALTAAVHVLENSGDRDSVSEGDGNLETLESIFAASPDERLRRLALAALLAQSTRTSGWTRPLRNRLRLYQNDPSPLVAEAAQFTFPPPEEEEKEEASS